VMGMSISFHLPGFQCHRRSATSALLSNVLYPVDCTTMAFLTKPVFRSSIARNKPSPARRDRLSLKEYSGDRVVGHPRHTIGGVLGSVVVHSFCIYCAAQITSQRVRTALC
jgi:hypothetical protein